MRIVTTFCHSSSDCLGHFGRGLRADPHPQVGVGHGGLPQGHGHVQLSGERTWNLCSSAGSCLLGVRLKPSHSGSFITKYLLLGFY